MSTSPAREIPIGLNSDRDLFTPPDKKTRKQRQKEEQAELSLPRNINQTKTFDEIEEEEKTIPVTQEVPKDVFCLLLR